jgi:hypothetical protein
LNESRTVIAAALLFYFAPQGEITAGAAYGRNAGVPTILVRIKVDGQSETETFQKPPSLCYLHFGKDLEKLPLK